MVLQTKTRASRSWVGVWWPVLFIAAAVVGIVFAAPYAQFTPSASRLGLNPAVPLHIVWLSLHALTAGTALLIGPFQFLHWIRSHHPALHRTVGKIYLAAVTVAGAMAIIDAVISVSGIVAQVLFLVLAVLWLGSATAAYTAVRRQQYQRHRIWMIRNYALTFAAVNLRLILVIGMVAEHLGARITRSEIYDIATWGSVLASLVVAEWLIVWRVLKPQPQTEPDRESKSHHLAT